MVKIFGYSFDPVDRRDIMMKLVSKAENCERIVIFDPRAQEIVKNLNEDNLMKDEFPKVLKRLIPCPCKFGEYFDLP